MNAMGDMSDPRPERGEEPDIILLGIEKTSFYMYKGEKFLNQLLLSDGEFPKPVLCVNFETLFDAKRVLGDGFSPATSWAIHPEIIERLRRDDDLIETDA
ncbi:hypothetical protein [Tateyamaria sp. ANG-S1]|uniref:hypothetical protein n=1 Tax=Tateyamaria sp. ANG-S1 TaxID=1577905 RepID=UPI00057C582E|nr:hypothetical protein [Tateyamaria sp. ANG-S1]KIC47733.1 hypothetical protein RA29_19150 [Tateyamaria sp. ANG-S1]